jgi:hypothetical protein
MNYLESAWPAGGGRKMEDNHNFPEKDIIKDRLLDIFQKQGILEKDEQDRWIFDKEKFFAGDFSTATYLGSVDNKQKHINAPLLWEKLQNISALDAQEYRAHKKEKETVPIPEPKPILNVPESAEKAFDPENILAKNYHLDFWDLYRGSSVKWDNIITAKNGEQINLIELFLATKLFRDFQAKRDETGNLLVLNPQSGKEEKVTVDWIYKNIGNFGKTGDLQKSVHILLRDHCPNLLANELVRYDDFSIKTTKSSGAMMRKEKEMKKRNTANYVSFNGIQYYIGRHSFDFNGKKIPTEKIKVVKLDSQKAGIVGVESGQERILAVFDLLSEEEKMEKLAQTKFRLSKKMSQSELSQRSSVGKKELITRMRPWIISNEIPKLKEESAENYAKRLSHLSDYKYLNQIGKELLNKSGLGIHNLTWREQQWLAAASFELGIQGRKEDLFDFSKKFGLAGLKSFLTCEFNIDNGNKILQIADKLESQDAEKVFARIAELVDFAQKKENELTRELFKENRGQVPANLRSELIGRANNIILKFSERLSENEKPSKKKEKTRQFLADLEQSQMRIDLVASLLIASKKAGKSQRLEDIRGLEIKSVGAEELAQNEKLWQKLKEMYRTNNSHKSNEDLERLLGDFETHRKYKAKFYLVYFDPQGKTDASQKLDNLVGFMRSSFFDGQRELSSKERYLGALNIDPLLQKFYFGENFLEKIITKEFLIADKLIAHVPKEGASHKILKNFSKKLGFKIEEKSAGYYTNQDRKSTIERIRVELIKKIE